MSPGTRKIIWATVVLLPLLVGVFFLLPATRENSSLQQQKAALEQQQISPDRIVRMAESSGTRARLRQEEVVVFGSYEKLLLVAKKAVEKGYIPSSLTRQKLVLAQE